MIKAAIIGFGGIAQAAHLPGYVELEKQDKVKLVAVCDIDTKRFEGKMKINIGGSELSVGNDIHKYTDWKEMLENEDVDMVDICLPTYLHSDVAVKVLNMGYDVLSEKPMSLTTENCKKMCEAAKNNGKKLMIGQCLRFNSGYNYIKKLVEEKTYGEVLTGNFRRLSSPPVWGFENWFMNKKLSGGALFDLHIHDVDIIRYIFGEPKTVNCIIKDVYSGNDIVNSQFNYKDYSIYAVGDWSREGMPFVADCSVAFEKATVEISGDVLTVYPRGEDAFKPELSSDSMYKVEIEFFIDMLENNVENNVNTPESAAKSICLAETLKKSSDNGAVQMQFDKN